jgi:hypothetical protein
MIFIIWHGLIVLVSVVLSILLPLLVVAIAPDGGRLDRKGFTIRLLAIGYPKKRSLRYMLPIIGLYYAVILLTAPDEPADAAGGVVTRA